MFQLHQDIHIFQFKVIVLFGLSCLLFPRVFIYCLSFLIHLLSKLLDIVIRGPQGYCFRRRILNNLTYYITSYNPVKNLINLPGLILTADNI